MKIFYCISFALFIGLIWSCEEKSHVQDLIEQAQTDSLRQDSIKKANAINLIGEWDISSFAGLDLEEGMMLMTFKEGNLIEITTPKKTHKGSYKLDQETKIISVIEEKKPEEWLIKSYSPEQMIIEAEDNEEKIDIILKKKSSSDSNSKEND